MRKNITVSVSCDVKDLANIGRFFELQDIPLPTTRSGLVRHAVKFLADIVKIEGEESFTSYEDAMTFFHSRDLSGQKWKDGVSNLKKHIHAQVESEAETFNPEQTIQQIREGLLKGE